MPLSRRGLVAAALAAACASVGSFCPPPRTTYRLKPNRVLPSSAAPPSPRARLLLKASSETPGRSEAESFSQWVVDSAVYLRTECELTSFKDGHRGVAARRFIDAATVLVKVPWNATLRVHDARGEDAAPCPLPPAFIDADFWKGSRWYVRMALWILYERWLGAKSRFAPYVRQLPAGLDTPVFWEQEDLLELQYPPLWDSVTALSAHLDVCQATLAAGSGGTACCRDFGAAEFKGAVALAWSRSFQLWHEGKRWHILAPMADMFNHHSGHHSEFRAYRGASPATGAAREIGGSNAAASPRKTSASGNGKGFGFGGRDKRGSRRRDASAQDGAVTPTDDATATSPDDDAAATSNGDAADSSGDLGGIELMSYDEHEQGSEVLISYGAKSNDRLLELYGFSEPENPVDTFAVPDLLGLLEDAETEEQEENEETAAAGNVIAPVSVVDGTVSGGGVGDSDGWPSGMTDVRRHLRRRLRHRRRLLRQLGLEPYTRNVSLWTGGRFDAETLVAARVLAATDGQLAEVSAALLPRAAAAAAVAAEAAGEGDDGAMAEGEAPTAAVATTAADGGFALYDNDDLSDLDVGGGEDEDLPLLDGTREHLKAFAGPTALVAAATAAAAAAAAAVTAATTFTTEADANPTVDGDGRSEEVEAAAAAKVEPDPAVAAQALALERRARTLLVRCCEAALVSMPTTAEEDVAWLQSNGWPSAPGGFSGFGSVAGVAPGGSSWHRRGKGSDANDRSGSRDNYGDKEFEYDRIVEGVLSGASAATAAAAPPLLPELPVVDAVAAERGLGAKERRALARRATAVAFRVEKKFLLLDAMERLSSLSDDELLRDPLALLYRGPYQRGDYAGRIVAPTAAAAAAAAGYQSARWRSLARYAGPTSGDGSGGGQ
ncbi:unnamed protein product [Phaeothamnion confervicola]